jgi:hypothetical protein
LNIHKKRWVPIEDYITNDNLDSWSCALMFSPSNSFTEQDMEVKEDPDEEGIVVDDSEDESEIEQEMQIIMDEEANEEM